MIRRVVWVTASVLALVLAPSAASAQRPMGIVDLINIPRVGDPQLAPDGASVLYTVSRPDWKASKRITHIWRQPMAGGEPLQLTTGTESETAPRFSPDGRQIAFVTKRGDNEFAQVYLLAADGGEARQLTSHASAVSNPTWAPDGSAIYFVAPEPKTDEERARDRAKDDVYGFDEDFKNNHLWKVVVNTRSESRLTSGDFSVESYDLSADGRTIAYQRAPTPLVESSDEAEIWTMRADGTSANRLTNNSVGEDSIRISPDGSQVLFVA